MSGFLGIDGVMLLFTVEGVAAATPIAEGAREAGTLIDCVVVFTLAFFVVVDAKDDVSGKGRYI